MGWPRNCRPIAHLEPCPVRQFFFFVSPDAQHRSLSKGAIDNGQHCVGLILPATARLQFSGSYYVCHHRLLYAAIAEMAAALSTSHATARYHRVCAHIGRPLSLCGVCLVCVSLQCDVVPAIAHQHIHKVDLQILEVQIQQQANACLLLSSVM